MVIANHEHRHQGIGSEALSLVVKYAFKQLQLHQLFANIGSDNEISLQLFTKFGFQKIGIKKDWNRVNNIFKDEILFQLIQ